MHLKVAPGPAAGFSCTSSDVPEPLLLENVTVQSACVDVGVSGVNVPRLSAAASAQPVMSSCTSLSTIPSIIVLDCVALIALGTIEMPRHVQPMMRAARRAGSQNIAGGRSALIFGSV